MILIKEDKSYLSDLDLKAIDHGFAELGIHSLKITNFLTDEQKEENGREARILTGEQWRESCEEYWHEVATKVERIVDSLNEQFTIYQYKNSDISFSNDNWDLFFWCNSGNMSYITLSPNTEQRTCGEQLETIEQVLTLLRNIDVDGIQATIQYTAIYNEDKVLESIMDYCEKMQNVFIQYGGHVGKIVKADGKFYFKKKGAKKRVYDIRPHTILGNVLAG